jgi:hypothetical protein
MKKETLSSRAPVHSQRWKTLNAESHIAESVGHPAAGQGVGCRLGQAEYETDVDFRTEAAG